MAVLIYDAGGPAERRYVLRPGLSTIGRARDKDIVIAHSKVSRRHAEVAMVAGRAYFKELGSSNSSHVNGEPVELAELKEGDEIRCGGALLLFSAEEDRAASQDAEAGAPAPGAAARPPKRRCLLRPSGARRRRAIRHSDAGETGRRALAGKAGNSARDQRPIVRSR